MQRGLVFTALVTAAVALCVVVGTGVDGAPHRLTVAIPRADNVVAGQDVRMAGARVGSVEDIELTAGGRHVRLSLGLDDEAWPLRQGARLTLRWGGTVSFSNRYFELSQGPADAPALSSGSSLPADRVQVPVEYDTLIGTFDRRARQGLRDMLDQGGVTFDAARVPLARSLERAPAAVAETENVLGALTEDQDEFETLVRSAATTVDAIDRTDPGLRELLVAAGTTLDATADRQQDLRDTVAAAPSMLVAARDTLRSADPTLRRLRHTLVALRPGVGEIRRTIPSLNHLLGTVVGVGPIASRSLRTLRGATPDLNRLLGRLAGAMPDLDSVGGQLSRELRCLRPYTPDIVAFVNLWGDFNSSTDGRDHYFRAFPQVILPATTNTQSMDSAQAAERFPGLRYAFPRPPGNNAGQPWFLPECGITEAALDPAKDPESRIAGSRAGERSR